MTVSSQTVTIDEGSTAVNSGSFSDPGADAWTATVDYGDNTGVQAPTLNADKTFALSHTYADSGTFTVIVTVTDDDGGLALDRSRPQSTTSRLNSPTSARIGR